MFAKLLVLCAVAAVAFTREYPAGVHPAVCPNYPYCDVEVTARHTPAGQPIPEWVYNPSVLPVAPVDPNHAPSAAARYPADFPAALCPNYPYCF